VFHISESQFDAGMETHGLREGPEIRVYSPARTVADCFKFRNRIGKQAVGQARRRGLVGENIETRLLRSLVGLQARAE